MATLTPERIREIAQNWYALQGHKDVMASPLGRVEFRTEIIQNLTALARVAEDRGARLFLCVEYRQHI
jgi:hypothetical protein